MNKFSLLNEFILKELSAWKRNAPEEADPKNRLNKWKNVPNVYFHFTDGIDVIETGAKGEVEKKTYFQLSTNIRTGYETPVGIYAYPSSLIGEEVPFADDRKYIIVFRARHPEKVIKISEYTQEQFEKDIEKLRKFGDTNFILKNLLNFSPKFMFSPASKLWALTYHIKKNNKDWYKLFRYLGYEGFVDDIGAGVIHMNEPTQAVFFGEAFVDSLDYILNPKEKEEADDDINLKKALFLHKLWLSSNGKKGKQVNFDSEYLGDKDFSNANLEKAIMYGTLMTNSRFIKTNLKGAVLTKSRFEGSYFKDTNLSEIKAEDTRFNLVKFEDVNFEKVKLTFSSFEGAFFENVNFKNATINNSSFGNTNFDGNINFEGTNLAGTSFYHSNLRNIKFTNSKLQGANFERAFLAGADFSGVKFTDDMYFDGAVINNETKGIPQEIIDKFKLIKQ